MNLKNQTLQLLIALLLAGIFLSCSSGGAENNTIEKNEQGEILAPEERTWNNDLIGEEISLHSDITDSLLNGLVINGHAGHLYVSDFGDMRLKRFDMNGKFLDSFGSKGKGPGEFQLIMDFDVSGSETLYAIDPRKIRLITFDARTTDFITEYETEPNPFRLVIVDNQLTFESSMAEKLFYRSDVQGNISNRFGEMMENQRQNSISTGGDIYAVEDDTGFVFAPRYASYLYYYDKEGNRTKTIRTPDRISFQEPIRETRGDQPITMPPETEFVTSDLKISGHFIYEVLQNNGDNNELPDNFIDVYDLKTGGYLRSVELPVPSGDVLVADNRLYLINSELAQVQAFQYSQ